MGAGAGEPRIRIAPRPRAPLCPDATNAGSPATDRHRAVGRGRRHGRRRDRPGV